jgi:hypothetical protein
MDSDKPDRNASHAESALLSRNTGDGHFGLRLQITAHPMHWRSSSVRSTPRTPRASWLLRKGHRLQAAEKSKHAFSPHTFNLLMLKGLSHDYDTYRNGTLERLPMLKLKNQASKQRQFRQRTKMLA